VILPDANDLPVHQSEKLKGNVVKKKQLSKERKEKGKRWFENTQQQDNCPHLRHERNNMGSKLGPYWAVSLGFMQRFTTCIFSTLGVCVFLVSHIPEYYFGNYMSSKCHYCSVSVCIRWLEIEIIRCVTAITVQYLFVLDS